MDNIRYRYAYNEQSSAGLTAKQGITIALGLLFITGWIFFRTLRPIP